MKQHSIWERMPVCSIVLLLILLFGGWLIGEDLGKPGKPPRQTGSRQTGSIQTGSIQTGSIQIGSND